MINCPYEKYEPFFIIHSIYGEFSGVFDFLSVKMEGDRVTVHVELMLHYAANIKPTHCPQSPFAVLGLVAHYRSSPLRQIFMHYIMTCSLND